MEIITQFKTCRKGLHQYPAEKRRCPECQKESSRRWVEANQERKRELGRKWREENREKQRGANHRWAEANREKQRGASRRWAEANPGRKRELGRKWREENREKQRELERKWREENLEKHRELRRLWAAANPGKVNANTAKRRAAKKQAIASWADHNKIKEIYKECTRLTKETGVKHQVDHIYPLQNKYMCGLHVETNLQILSAIENTIKNNRSWPGQLDCQKL